MKNIIFLLIIITITISACNTNHTQNNLTSRDSAIMNIQNLEHRLYGDSVQVIKRGVAMETIIAYAKFAHNFPEDSLSPEFLFKAAEIARALHNGKEAVLYYNMIYTDFPENEKAPTALFLEAFTYENILKEATLYNGDGGTNRIFLNFGYKAFKGFSVGLQGNYVFGKIENSIINQQEGASLATKYETRSNVKGYSLDVGFQYKTALNKKVDLNLGASFELSNTIDTEGNEYLYSVSIASFESPRDTILSVESVGYLKSPVKTSLGVGVGKEYKWFIGADYSFQNALELQGSIFNSYSKIKYDKYSKIAIGGFYIPKFNSISSYWERVTYRAGLKFEKTGLLVDAVGNGIDFTAVDDFGISFGVGLPLSQQLSNINLGFEFGKRGKTTDGLVQENYFNFRLSLSLNDKWFKKIEIF